MRAVCEGAPDSWDAYSRGIADALATPQTDPATEAYREWVAELYHANGELAVASPEQIAQYKQRYGPFIAEAELTDDEAAALSSIEWEEETRISKSGKTGRTKTTRIKYRWHDKRGALDSLRRHLGMDRDDVGGDDGPVVKVYIGWDPSKREE